MFDKPLKYRLVQVNKGKRTHSYQREFIFKFFHSAYAVETDLVTGEVIRVQTSRRKIIVQVKQYSPVLFRVDFYAVSSNKDKKIVNPNLSVYRYLTKLGNAHRVASTIFAILGELRQQYGEMSYAFEAATLLNESDDSNNRRFRAYSTMLKLLTGSVNSRWRAFAYPENSFIFVLQNQHLPDKKSILNEYGRIFGKTINDPEEISHSG